MTRPEFIESVAQLCVEFGGSVTSWIRTMKRNTIVGGHPRSRHMTGFGVDVVLDEESHIPAFRDAAYQLGLSVLDEGDHLHIQPFGPTGRLPT